LTGVSFEDYDVGPHGTFIYNHFHSVNQQIRNAGLKTFPMITTVNIEYLRQLFDNPTKFINDVVEHAIKYDYSGNFPVVGLDNAIMSQYCKFRIQFGFRTSKASRRQV
jgi:hypothetical protein